MIVDMLDFYSTANAEDKAKLDLLFVLFDKKYKKLLEEHSYNVAGVVCNENVEGFNTIISDNPKETFWKMHNSMEEENIPTKIGKNCTISDSAYISPYNVEIGDNCFIGENTVIGGDGFQVFQDNGKNKLVKHFGKIKIGNDCVIQNNCCIDRGLFKHVTTTLKDNVMLDNLVHIGHNATLENNVMCACGSIVGGYAIIGENTFLGINSTIKQLVEIGKNNYVGMGANIVKNTEDDQKICGYKATTLEEGKRRVLKWNK